MSKNLLFLSQIALFFLIIIGKTCCYHPEANMNFLERAKRHGYPAEVHKIFTKDGYILGLYRIPNGYQNFSTPDTNRSIVLFVHGMGGTPQNFILLGPKRSVAYYFADRGFDVWLLEARGNEGVYQKKHVKYDWNENKEYWLYGLHEIAVYDITAAIDFALKKTGQKKLFYIGHSSGGYEAFMLLSDRPEYNDKVKMVGSWGMMPIMNNVDDPLVSVLSALSRFFKGLFNYLDMTEIFPQMQILKPTISRLCSDASWKDFCNKISWVIGSHKSFLQDPKEIELYVAGWPPRWSVQMPMHFCDNVNSGKFRKYDFGPKTNLKKYGTKIPPAYNLSAITAPITFFVAPKDAFATMEDYHESALLLPNAYKSIFEIPFSKFTHTDYALAVNGSEILYKYNYQIFKDFDDGKMPPEYDPLNKNKV